VVQKQFTKLADLWKTGLSSMQAGMKRASLRKRAAAEQDFAIALTCYNHFKSVANQVEFYLLRDKLALERGEDLSKAKARMREIVRDEMQLAREQYDVATRHSIIGYEASNHYYYRPLNLVEKVLNCQQVLDEIDGRPIV
jgi:hypothetical protein